MEEMVANQHSKEPEIQEKKQELELITLELEKARMEISELEEIKLEFLRMVSHEVRTALNGISGPIGILETRLKDPQNEKFFSILQSSAARLEKITLTALAITELRTMKGKFPEKQIDLRELVLNVSVLTRTLRLKKNIIFVFEDMPGKAIISGNEYLIKTCLKGIIENALVYSPSLTRVNIRMGQNENTVFCEVSDSGPGFSDPALKNLFKFFTPGNNQEGQSLGLGLAFAKMIMDAHQGEIQVVNRPEGGAMVRVGFRVAECGLGICD